MLTTTIEGICRRRRGRRSGSGRVTDVAVRFGWRIETWFAQPAQRPAEFIPSQRLTNMYGRSFAFISDVIIFIVVVCELPRALTFGDASFCIAQRRRTEFLCSEKEGTARGTRGRFFRCVGLAVTSQKSTTKRTHHTHKGKNARRSLDSGLPHSLR